MQQDIHAILQQYYGYSSFREGQEELIRAILSGRDALAIMPTGAGKSICYQVPAIAFSGITLVISPLISLMKDQVSALNQAGVRAAYFNSSLTPRQMAAAMRNAREGMYKIIYVAPERLFTDVFMEFALSAEISMLAVDEAHCISQWGHDFRPSYTRIMEFVEALPRRPVITAFTATATEQVKQDILHQLRLQEPYCVTTGFDRKNLRFAVERPYDKTEFVLHYAQEHPDRSGIVYCCTRKGVDELYEQLGEKGVAVSRYHAGLPDEQRRRGQEDFLYDRCRVMVATNAFGMGIDKSNVSFVIHYNMPMNIEQYYQEAGRAGRDGEPADCILLYSGSDVRLCRFLIDKGLEMSEELAQEQREQLRQREYEKLKQMTFYATIDTCLRQFLLRYFGEHAPDTCGNCSNCEENSQLTDVTEAARDIIAVLVKTGRRFGAGMILDILAGAKTARIAQWGFDKMPEYGALGDKRQARAVLDCMLSRGYLQTSEGEYPVLQLTDTSNELRKPGACLEMKVFHRKPRPSKKANVREEVDDSLLGELKRLRKQLADRLGVPAYVVFTDAALRDMCQKLPQSLEEMREVNGVGAVKLERFGQQFLEVIAAYMEKNEETQSMENGQ